MSETHSDVVIIGSGFSGLLCTIYLEEAGVEDVRVFEMNESVGGVWAHNGVGSYPGAACDVPSYMYLPFLDRTRFIPSKKYVSQTEIADYAELLTDYGEIRDKLTFFRKVTQLQYLGDGKRTWQITTEDPRTGEVAEVVTGQHVVAANGPLSSPRMPELPGMDSYQGESFHTARWDRNASLAGKRVGVIGTGASAGQVITTIVDEVEHLTVFQRTPTWVVPRDDEPTPDFIRKKFEAGGYGERLRYADWKEEFPPDPNELFSFEDLQDEHRNGMLCAEIVARIKKEVEDPALAEILTPDYPFFCKRVLVMDDYYSTYNKTNVTLVNDPGGVVAITETGVTMSTGDNYDVDVLIYATGFDSNFIPFPITGKDGISLADKFGANEANRFQMTRPHSLWGIHVDDMPNFYMMIGPQSLNPVTNVTQISEQQSQYLSRLIKDMQAAGQTECEPTHAAVESWTERCNASSEGKVWLRCNNWYMKTTKTDVAEGRERSAGMWMNSYIDYLKHLLGHEGGKPEDLLQFN